MTLGYGSVIIGIGGVFRSVVGLGVAVGSRRVGLGAAVWVLVVGLFVGGCLGVRVVVVCVSAIALSWRVSLGAHADGLLFADRQPLGEKMGHRTEVKK